MSDEENIEAMGAIILEELNPLLEDTLGFEYSIVAAYGVAEVLVNAGFRRNV